MTMQEQTIRLEEIERLGPCEDQMRLVKDTWPTGIPLTIESMNLAIALRLNLGWLSRKFLSGPAKGKCERARSLAWAEYERVCEPVTEAYNRGRMTMEECMRLWDVALAEYKRVSGEVLLRELLEARTMAVKG